MPAAMNAANEIAVDAFLNGGIRFTDISDVIQSTMQAHTPSPSCRWKRPWKPTGGRGRRPIRWSMRWPAEKVY